MQGASQAALVDVHVVNNLATSTDGGGLLVSGAQFAMTRGSLVGNDAVRWGGGLMISSTGTLQGVTVEGNQAVSRGGAIYASGATMLLTLTDILLNSNVLADTRTTMGGALYCDYGSVTLERVRVSASVADYGSAAFADTACNLTGTNVIADQNVGYSTVDLTGVSSLSLSFAALTNGGSYAVRILPGSSASLSMQHTVLANHNIGVWTDGIGPTPSFQWCNAWGNSVDYYGLPSPTGTNGNIAVDPSFENVVATDLHLGPTSPLIDAGDPTVLDPDGSPSDIGAYGGPGADQWDLDGDGYPSWWQPGPYDYGNYPALGWDCDDLDATVFPGSGC